MYEAHGPGRPIDNEFEDSIEQRTSRSKAERDSSSPNLTITSDSSGPPTATTATSSNSPNLEERRRWSIDYVKRFLVSGPSTLSTDRSTTASEFTPRPQEKCSEGESSSSLSLTRRVSKYFLKTTKDVVNSTSLESSTSTDQPSDLLRARYVTKMRGHDFPRLL